MKKRSLAVFSVLLAMILSLSLVLTGCFGCGDDDSDSGEPKTYTIQYTDDDGTHQLTVTEGMPYSLESVPYRYGYEFLGLFDAQTGGTQYVDAKGASVALYTDKGNKILYPQFKAVDYTVILDYQGAAVTGDRSLTVAYGSSLPALPKNLSLEHNVFTGWYTKEGGKGTRIADAYGNIPAVSVLNETNFELDDTTHSVTLYAGFELEKFTVTFHFDGSLPDEDVQVPYNTPISQVVPTTRNSAGFAGLVWSKTANDTELANVFDGKVTGKMDLYIVEWAPVIELNVDGGDEITPVVARAGSTISLPTPTKSLAKFLYWETVGGVQANITKMPSTSTTLKAIWQAKIEFDENGGSLVNDISEKKGVAITLPEPTKDGYIFAGWYTTDKQVYSTNSMPSEGIALKAGWYVAKSTTITLIENNFDSKVVVGSNTLTVSQRFKVDLSEIIPKIGAEGVRIRYKVNFLWGNTYKHCQADAKVALYDGPDLNSKYELKRKDLSCGTDVESYMKESFSGTAKIYNNALYVYYAGAGQLHISLSGGYGDKVAFYDMNLELAYPDTTHLYL